MYNVIWQSLLHAIPLHTVPRLFLVSSPYKSYYPTALLPSPDILNCLNDHCNRFLLSILSAASDFCKQPENAAAISEGSALREQQSDSKFSSLPAVQLLFLRNLSASAGHSFIHLPQRIHSVWSGVFVISTSILHTRAHFPQEMHLRSSTWIPKRDTLFINA